MRSLNLLIKPVSSLCNMRCKYCFYADVAAHRAVKSYGMMSEETLEKLVKKVFESAAEMAVFTFQGGEPTLAGLSFYHRFIELQKKYNRNHISVFNTIQTNGYLIDETWAKFFAENNFLVGLSIDGTKETHDAMRHDAANFGTYHKAVAAARLFDEYRVDYNILCVVNNQVSLQAKEVYRNLKKYRYIQFIACLDGINQKRHGYSLREERYAKFLIETFHEYYMDFRAGNYVSVRNFDNYIGIFLGREPENCAMRGTCSCYFVIEGDGSVFPCDFYVLDEWKLGNIYNDSFEDMLRSARAVEFVHSSFEKNDECARCEYYALCRGGCRRERVAGGCDHRLQNKFCTAYKKFFEACYGEMAEMAQKIRELNGREEK